MSLAWAITVNSAAATLVLGTLSRSTAFAITVHHAIYFVALILSVAPGALTAPATLAQFVFAPAAAAWIGALLGHALSVVLDLARVLIDVREPAAPRRLLERVPYTLALLVGIAAVVLGVSQALAGTASTTAIAVALVFGVLFVVAGAAGLVLVHADVSTLVHALAAVVLIAIGVLVFNATLASASITLPAAAGYTVLALALTYLIVGALFIMGTNALHMGSSRAKSAGAWLLLFLMVASVYVVGAIAANSATTPGNALVVAQYLFVAFWVWALVLLALMAYSLYQEGGWNGYALLEPLEGAQPAYLSSFAPAANTSSSSSSSSSTKNTAASIANDDLAVFDRIRAAQKKQVR